MSFTKEQIFLVTGASSGIGQGVALKLNELGASVVAIARRQDKLEETRAAAKYPENFICEPKDLTEGIEELPQYIKGLKDKYGRFQGLAYCAGIARLNPLQTLDYFAMRNMYDINVFAPLMMLKGFADRRVNNGKGSACVFISSISGKISPKSHTEYSGTKAALSAAIKSASKEIVSRGIRVNVISPSDILTPMLTNDTWYLDKIRDMYPLGVGEVSDVSNMVAFLLSDKAKWITGQDYILDCGAY